MTNFSQITLLTLVVLLQSEDVRAEYTPDWPSIDSRPLPKWYDEGKVGIFVHLGVYAVPGFVSEWFWCYLDCPDRKMKQVENFMIKFYPKGATYQDFAKDFKLQLFNATDWVRLFERAGASYAVLTSKHHEGFTLWPSKSSFSWNSVDVGPHRDVVGEFAAAVRASGRLKLGLYHSLFEWFNPLYELDRKNNFSTNFYSSTKGTAELYELVRLYEPDLLWSDGDAGPVQYWDSLNFLSWLYNSSPVRDNVVVNDRWGTDTHCKHGGFLDCKDRFRPTEKMRRKWERAMTLDKQSWGHRRAMSFEDVLTNEQLIKQVIETISEGGNILVNVGPNEDGIIDPIFQERLVAMGDFLNNNKQAVYGTRVWQRSNDSLTEGVHYTRDDNNLYAFFLKWPRNGQLVLGSPRPTRSTLITLLGHDSEQLVWRSDTKVTLQLPSLIDVHEKLKYAWAIKMTNLANLEDNDIKMG